AARSPDPRDLDLAEVMVVPRPARPRENSPRQRRLQSTSTHHAKRERADFSRFPPHPTIRSATLNDGCFTRNSRLRGPPPLMCRVLVTGGAGFLGSHLCERLLADGNDVLCVDNYFTGSRDNIAHLLGHARFELLRHDVTFPLYVE